MRMREEITINTIRGFLVIVLLSIPAAVIKAIIDGARLFGYGS